MKKTTVEAVENAFDDYDGKKLVNLALKRLNSKTSKYLLSDVFWSKANELENPILDIRISIK